MKKTHVHFLGIGGSGASAAASIAGQSGFEVTGCDNEIQSDFLRDFLPDQILKGHNPSHTNNVDILAISPAILSLDPDNPEIISARENGIEVLTWQEFTGKYLLSGKKVIAISGTHGKSTVTAMIGVLLEDAGFDPTVLLGAEVKKWGKNFRLGKSEYFVIEADEFNNNFLNIKPEIAVISSIEMDHPEFFENLTQIQQSFEKFLLQTKSCVVANISNQGVAEVLKVVMKYSDITCLDYSKSELNLKLKLLGRHNIENAKAAFQVGLVLGIGTEKIIKSLSSFVGIGRRLELLGEVNGAQIYSDFGHHPTAIKETIEALRYSIPEKEIWLFFEPHMFSRTKWLFKEFVEVFKNLPVKYAYIKDIYASRENDPGDIDSNILVEAIGQSKIEYCSDVTEKFNLIKSKLSKNDIVVFMGAGGIDKIIRRILKSD